MDQNDIFEISKFAIFFVLSLSNRIISGGPQYRETCQWYLCVQFEFKVEI